MLISLHDNYQRRIAHIDNALPKAMHYNDDKWNRNLAYGTGLFDFTIDRQDLEIESQLVVGNYISFRYNSRDYMFTILRSEKSSDDRKIIVHSEYLSLGLLKSTQDPLEPSQSHTLEWYLTQSGILVNSGIKLGINEVPDLVRKIKIDGEQTALQRLTSFATNFGAEIEYVTTLNRDGTLKSLVVNFYKKFDGVNQGVGINRQDLTLSYGKNVSGIKQTTDITDFFSMITPTGKDGLTITSLDRTEYDDKGNVLFFTRPGQSSIYAPQSAQRFPSRLIRTNNDYTDHKYRADGTSDQNTLYTLALNELKKHCDPSIVYDVTGFYDLNIGDTVKIFDASFNPPLTLQARVAEQTISFSNPSNNKTVFGNIIALESQASQALTGRLKELVDQVTPYRFEIVSDNGLTFKNSTGSTTLTARVYKGSNIDEVPVDSFEWLIDGVKFGSTSKSQLANASQVTGTAVVRYNAKIGDTVIGGIEATLQDVSDGTDGISPTVTINPDTSLTIVDAKGTSTTPVLKGDRGDQGVQGLQGTAGTQGVPGPKGADGNTQYTHIAYANSADGVTNFSTSDSSRTYIGMYIDFNIDDSTTPSDYSWTLIKGADGTQGIPGNPGTDGKTPYFHTAWSYSADGTDGFTTTYPNLNLLDGTKDFSRNWTNSGGWTNDGTYKGLTVKKKTGQWNGIYKTFTAPKDGAYTFSAYIKASGTTTTIIRYRIVNGVGQTDYIIGSNFDWRIDTVTISLKTGQTAFFRYEISTNNADAILWNAGHKWEPGSIATPYMQSASEVTTADWPKYIGHYTDFTQADSANPSDYTWGPMRGDDGVGVTSTVITYANSTSGTTAPSTGWTSSVPTLVKGQYLWTKTVWTYTDTTSKTGYSVTYISKDGTNGTDGTSGIIVSSVAPSSPQNGQLWQDTSTMPQLVKKWSGSSWVIWKMYVENMVVDTISSMSSDLGNMIGGTLKLMDVISVNGTLKKFGIYQSKLGLLSSGAALATTSTMSDTQMGVVSLNKGELRFIVTDYTENLKGVQDAGMSDQNHAFIKFDSYDNGKDIMTIGSSGDIVFNGITSQDTPWIAMGNGAYYKNMFSRVYISYSIKATSTANIPLGVLPVGLRPFRGLHLTANAWGTTLGNDRHIEVRTTGEVTLYSPANGASYDGEVSFTI